MLLIQSVHLKENAETYGSLAIILLDFTCPRTRVPRFSACPRALMFREVLRKVSLTGKFSYSYEHYIIEENNSKLEYSCLGISINQTLAANRKKDINNDING